MKFVVEAASVGLFDKHGFELNYPGYKRATERELDGRVVFPPGAPGMNPIVVAEVRVYDARGYMIFRRLVTNGPLISEGVRPEWGGDVS